MNVFRSMDRFFFAPVSATGFGLMRVTWGAAVFLSFALQWPDVTRYYSAAGQLPPWLSENMTGPLPSASLLWWLPHPDGVFLAYLLLLAFSACACIGLRPRATVIATTVLLISFHVRNPWHTTGGDVILRSVGFILSIGPGGLHAFSIARAREQMHHWMRSGKLLTRLTMPAWPQRLLLWELIIIYVQSLWSKLLGTMWWNGTAVGVALHHTHFGRFALSPVADRLSEIGALLGWSVMVWEACWLLLLVPKGMIPSGVSGQLRRWLLLTSFLIHTAFSVLLRLGSFLTAMPAILLGNLQADDVDVMRKMVNRKWHGNISMFYDGQCGFCSRSTCALILMDWLRRLRPVNFRSAQEHRTWAPDLLMKDLDRTVHVRFPDGKIFTGFCAFRALATHLPPLWPVAPLLYLPGMKFVGDRIYKRIAARRKQCTHGDCLR